MEILGLIALVALAVFVVWKHNKEREVKKPKGTGGDFERDTSKKKEK